jgi:hypothetical protein
MDASEEHGAEFVNHPLSVQAVWNRESGKVANQQNQSPKLLLNSIKYHDHLVVG